MKAKYSIFILACAISFIGCENYFDKKYMDNGDPQISVVRTYDYVLAESDYKTIADNKQNKAYAAALDEEGGTTANTDALARIGSEKRFNEVASADMYIPAFIYSKYPHLDPGSMFNVTYRTEEELPSYLNFYNQTPRYELTYADYKTIWGDDGSTQYISPATESKIAELGLLAVEDDYLLGVRYHFSSKEPSEGGKDEGYKETIYIYEDGYLWKPYTFPANIMMLPAEAHGQVFKWLVNTYPYAEKDDAIALMAYDDAAKLYQATEYRFDGAEWKANLGVTEETMSFVLAEGWKANLSTYYRQAIAGDGNMGKLIIQDVELEDGITFVWAFQNAYGMKASSYYKTAHYSESWFMTPPIKLKNSKEPALSFDQAVNYNTTDDRFHQCTVWVSTDYAGDVTTATWTQLPWNLDDQGNAIFPPGDNWTFLNSGRMDLSAWNNQTITIGFRYKTLTGESCPTWEVKNILVSEPEEEEE